MVSRRAAVGIAVAILLAFMMLAMRGAGPGAHVWANSTLALPNSTECDQCDPGEICDIPPEEEECDEEDDVGGGGAGYDDEDSWPYPSNFGIFGKIHGHLSSGGAVRVGTSNLYVGNWFSMDGYCMGTFSVRLTLGQALDLAIFGTALLTIEGYTEVCGFA